MKMKISDMTEQQRKILDEAIEAIEKAESDLRAAMIPALVSHPFYFVLENDSGMWFRCGNVGGGRHGFGSLDDGFPVPSRYTREQCDELEAHFKKNLPENYRLLRMSGRDWAEYRLLLCKTAANSLAKITQLEI